MKSLAAVLILICLAMGAWTKARAGLGDLENSIDRDGQSLRAVHKTSQATGYTVHLLSTSTVVVKEYVGSDGRVFAVSWRGMARPDLSQIFGSYWDEYSRTEKQNKKAHGRSVSEVKTTKIVVRRGGHMRDIHGLAYIPELVPTGVEVGGLQ